MPAVATVTAGKKRGIVRVDVALTCVAGAIAATPIGAFYGRLVGLYIDPVAGAGATLNSNADILITDALTGAPVISDLTAGAAANGYRPTQVVATSAGVAVTAAATATNVDRDIFVAGKLNVAVANATTTDTGLLSLIFEEAA